LDVIAHVEAVSGGKQATILGTKKAVRKLAPSIQGSSSKEDLYALGYYGKFYGSPVIATPQRHKTGSTDFVFDDNFLTVRAGDEKPIKCVYEGESTIVLRDAANAADDAQEYWYREKYGLALTASSVNGGVGLYEFED
jgi:hypothetical protein